ncbi:MAG TPA: formylglycine-generating enzyme family protein, partial [Candidatus Hydrogenedentes bacterium]|nr:formylglycine-generating enzyme family protein [Candidatus Hydrogenedentota bacterium]
MMERDLRKASPLAWFIVPDAAELQRDMIRQAMSMEADQDTALRRELESLSSVSGDAPQWLDLYVRSCAALGALSSLKTLNLEALRRAITHLSEAYPDTYTAAPTYLARLDEFEKQLPAIREGLAAADAGALEAVNQLRTLQREALLANPLLDFDRVLVIRRSEGNLGLPQNWQGNCSLPRRGYDNELLLLSPFADNKPPTRLFKPERDYLVGDVDIHFNGDRMLFSMLGSHDRWQVWEMASDGTGLRQVTPGVEPDVDNYDACYLPDGRIIFDSTRCFQGIPCVGGSDAVANLYIMNADGTGIRQLCFDQDHNWCPTVLNNGRILYSRWEYSDTPHYFSRLLFHMNPDGTNQVEFYGSNSFWPNSMFYTRPIPNHPSKVVTIVSGHHGVPRMGELVILDPAKGRKEADGVVQRIPGYGQPVEPVIVDQLVQEVWPKFLHPYPLSEHFFLVSCKPTPERPWGLYLVDSFDNMLLLHEEPGYAIFEPVPFRAQPAPQSIPDRVNLAKKDATVYLMDVYQGNGLRNVPRGTVKSLRLFSFHYGYQRIGGHQHIGMEGPWDVHRILGTVPV